MKLFYLSFISLLYCFNNKKINRDIIPLNNNDSIQLAILSCQVPAVAENRSTYGLMTLQEKWYFYDSNYLFAISTVHNNSNNGLSETTYQYFCFNEKADKGILVMDSLRVKTNLSIDSFLQKTIFHFSKRIVDRIIDSNKLIFLESFQDGGKEAHTPIVKRDNSYCDSAYFHSKKINSFNKKYFSLSGKVKEKVIFLVEMIYNDNPNEHINGIQNSKRKMIFKVEEKLIKRPPEIKNAIDASKKYLLN